jgi:hypothetical protein
MLNETKYKKIGNLLWMVALLFFVFVIFTNKSLVHGVSSLQINFSGKIVTSAGLDISSDSPSCISDVGADTCDFQIKFYNHASEEPGTLLGSEVFENIELGDYRGFFNLKIGSGVYTSGTHASIKDIFLDEEDVYIEVLFDGSGSSNFNFENVDLERFVVSHSPLERMLVGASPYAISARGAIDEFQLKVKTGASGTNKGLIYFDGGDDTLRVYDGAAWRTLVYQSVFENISTPLTSENLPEVSGSNTASLTTATDFVVYGDYVFVVHSGTPGSLEIYDIKTSSTPSLIGSAISLTGFNNVHDIKILGNYAYILADDSILTVDISDVNSVSVEDSLSVVNASGSALTLDIQGRFGYAVTSEAYFVVLDLSGSSPQVVSSVDLGALTIVDVEVRGQYAYVLTNNALVTVDIATPSVVATAGSLAFSASTATALDVDGRYGYVTTSTHLYVVNLLNPASISDVSSLSLGVSNVTDFVISGRNAFVLNGASPSSLLSVDVSTVTSLDLLGSVSFTGKNSGKAITIQGKSGYALTNDGLVIFDLKGIETSSILTNSFETFSGIIKNDLSIHKDLSVFGGMHVGSGGIYSSGSLSVDGQVRVVGGLGVGTGDAVYINTDGYLVASSSSLRYKRNVESYGSVLSQLSNLDMVRFTWDENTMSSGIRDVGMIAEEVAKYIPDLVIFNKFGQPEGLRYDKMGVYAIAGLNELKSEFDEFKAVMGAKTEEIIYTSESEFEVGALVSRDFSGENMLLPFDDGYSPLFGIVTEKLDYENDVNEEVVEEGEGSVEEEGEVLFEYKISPYFGVGEYEILVHKKTDSEVEIFEAGAPLYLEANGEISLLEDENNASSLILGYILEPLEFEENTFSTITKVYLTYLPLKFGFNSFTLSSLFESDLDDGRVTLGGGHINIRGNRGSFNFLETKMLNVDDRIIIVVEEGKPRIKVDGVDLLDRVSELEEKLIELEGVD